MSKVIILRALAWGRDARVERWAKIYKKHIPLFGIWGDSIPSLSVYSITSIKRNPQKKILIGLSYIWFSFKSFFFVLRHAKKNDIIVFIDLETILIAWIAAYLKGSKIHYDIADPFYLAKPIPGKKLWKYIEKLFIKYSNKVTVPHMSRLLLFIEKKEAHITIVENVPLFNKSKNYKDVDKKSEYIHIGYFGGLESDVRGLENIAKIVMKDNRLKLTIAGSGTLSGFFDKLSQQCDRISYLGQFTADELPSISQNIDIYYAYYSPDKFLHTIAAPNKYYEHLFLEIPILTSCIIPQSHNIIKNKTGWCIKNDEEALHLFIDNIFIEKINWSMYKENCRKIWKNKYSNYYSQIKL